MLDLSTSLIVLFIGIATGFVDSTMGGGGMISIPFLIFMGLPPHVAIATDRLGGLGQVLAASIKYLKAGQIRWKYVPILTLISVASAVIGSNIVFEIDEKIFNFVIAVLMIVLLPVILVHKHLGIERRGTSLLMKSIGYFIYFLLMTFEAFFGTGAAQMVTYTLLFFFGFTMIENKATDSIPWIVMTLVSLIVFVINGAVDIHSGIFLLIGMTIGGYLGAHVILKAGNVWVRSLFVMVVILSAVKLLVWN